MIKEKIGISAASIPNLKAGAKKKKNTSRNKNNLSLDYSWFNSTTGARIIASKVKPPVDMNLSVINKNVTDLGMQDNDIVLGGHRLEPIVPDQAIDLSRHSKSVFIDSKEVPKYTRTNLKGIITDKTGQSFLMNSSI